MKTEYFKGFNVKGKVQWISKIQCNGTVTHRFSPKLEEKREPARYWRSGRIEITELEYNGRLEHWKKLNEPNLKITFDSVMMNHSLDAIMNAFQLPLLQRSMPMLGYNPNVLTFGDVYGIELIEAFKPKTKYIIHKHNTFRFRGYSTKSREDLYNLITNQGAEGGLKMLDRDGVVKGFLSANLINIADSIEVMDL